jgi:hypothetical protein
MGREIISSAKVIKSYHKGHRGKQMKKKSKGRRASLVGRYYTFFTYPRTLRIQTDKEKRFIKIAKGTYSQSIIKETLSQKRFTAYKIS